MARRPLARSLAAALARRLARAPERGLATCPACRRDFVEPADWRPVGEDRWWILLRCAECRASREVTVANAVAERFDDELARSAAAIAGAARRLDGERMAAEADAFVAALRSGLIDAADFAR